MKYVYFLGEAKSDKNLLGGKGANLNEMTKIGLPVPPGFIITTDACKYYYKNDKYPKGLKEETEENLKKLEKASRKFFGSNEDPLLLSIRSGSPFSMPGMMDTILNLGLNDITVSALVKKSKNERFVLDCYRRFIQMFSDVVLKIDHDKFEHILEKYKKGRKDTDLTTKDLKKVIADYKLIVKKSCKRDFPSDPKEQLYLAINAVFESWNNKRAITYRQLNKISDDVGTAVNIQSMVFGNLGWDSGTGVGFTRNPSTGQKEYFGEYLVNAQGEDVVAGIRTPKPLKDLKRDFPKAYNDLIKVYRILENHFKDMQDFEFTIEKGKLYMLQTRNGKRTANAAVKIAVDLANEDLITKEEAIMRVNPEQLEQILHKHIDSKAKLNAIAKGLAASPGAAIGKVVFTPEDAVKSKEKTILVRLETSPEDVHGMAVAQGVLTARGGITSHAAVVARGMGKPCVSGCEDIHINEAKKILSIGNITIKEGDVITIDGTAGCVYLGEAPLVEPAFSPELKQLLKWVDETKRLGVMTNADTPEGATKAIELGAEGIGLCRTERMFNAKERLPIVRKMILAETKKERLKYLDILQEMQRSDFKKLLKIMGGRPVTVRLLDPPLHEFLPSYDDLLDEIVQMKLSGKSQKIIREKERLLGRVKVLKEVNPMLGHRGVRVALTYPEIYEMQIRAIYEACADLIKQGVKISPEIMVPQVCTAEELKFVHDIVNKVSNEIEKKRKVKVKIKFGTMVEVVRACMRAGKLAEYAEFFSFGTNDLTQATFSFSREDAEAKFLPLYNEKVILRDNPFEILDQKGVGRLMMITVKWGKKTRPDLKIGICGEHGGEPSAVEFCHNIGLTYVSCSPYRVPIAKLAAAQAVIKGKQYKK
jgi:pyruvate,orthophosphate dikinase